jgi:hypothetical protein
MAYQYGSEQSTYTPTYTRTSPEATWFVDNIDQINPVAAQQYQYAFDGATLTDALNKTIGDMAGMGPVEIPNFHADLGVVLNPQSGLGIMMAYAGRPVQIEGGYAVNSDPQNLDAMYGTYGFRTPAPENYVPLDTAYLTDAAANGDRTRVMGLAYTYANIGGYPYAIVPSWDPFTGQQTDGITAVCMSNPNVTLSWSLS